MYKDQKNSINQSSILLLTEEVNNKKEVYQKKYILLYNTKKNDWIEKRDEERKSWRFSIFRTTISIFHCSFFFFSLRDCQTTWFSTLPRLAYTWCSTVINSFCARVSKSVNENKKHSFRTVTVTVTLNITNNLQVKVPVSLIE